MRTCIVEMHDNVVESVSPALGAEVCNSIEHRAIREKYAIISHAFGYIDQTVDSVQESNN
jgi:hypothetical protein